MTIKRMILYGLILGGLIGCSPAPSPVDKASTAQSGSLRLVANGEKFVREGFISKDGWQIFFDHLTLTLADINAYQTDPPFDPTTQQTPSGAHVGLSKPITVDLAAGDETALPIEITTLADVPVGQYNALSWRMIPAQGYSIIMEGTATQEEKTIPFTIKIDKEYAYYCGEYVGDSRKGILSAEGSAELEATFHVDHIFGDANVGLTEALNQGAMGFEPLAQLAGETGLDVDLDYLQTTLATEDYQKLSAALATLGHVGEGHCFEASGGLMGNSE